MKDPRSPEQRRRDADALQALEGNPLTDEEKEMFARWDREGLTGDQQRALILAMFKKT